MVENRVAIVYVFFCFDLEKKTTKKQQIDVTGNKRSETMEDLSDR